MFIVDRFGRKILILFGGICTTIALISFGFVVMFLSFPIKGN
jgi:hypothetical protein